MEYRKLPHGNENLSVIGMGFGKLHEAEDAAEILNYGIEQGINFFDLCAAEEKVLDSFAAAAKGRREKLYTQMHFGIVYEDGLYSRSNDFKAAKAGFEEMLTRAKTDYTDFGYFHCIDEEADFEQLMGNGLFDYVCSLKEQGVVRHIGFSSHSPAIARRFLDTGMIDLFMFSINPAYDYAEGEWAKGAVGERAELYREAQKRGVGITAMKPFAAGQLLDERLSPIKIALTIPQCLGYTLDRPAVLSCVAGVSSFDDLKELLRYDKATEKECDYSLLSKAAPAAAVGNCVYCNHCAPCPEGLNIGLINKYYDLAKVGDELAAAHYRELSLHAEDCVACGHCDESCPFEVEQTARMERIGEYFRKRRVIKRI